jgi:hypothetical protein
VRVNYVRVLTQRDYIVGIFNQVKAFKTPSSA